MDHPRIGIGRAALLARLLNHVTCNLRGTINLDETVYAWTDSRIVLCWLQTSVHTLEVFVANRVSQITGSETPLVWRHVPGEWNPADCASRGCRAPDLVSHPLWWGPQWLTESPQEWPFNECRAPLGPPDRAWHYCDIDGRQASFLCPNGTVFSQGVASCDWWFNVRCALSPALYPLNARLYRRRKSSKPKPHRVIDQDLIDGIFL
ncbi:hypothetical protein NE865_01196 [Phthorimaea operculella]|nr:hypothetical protein NE865_01196 [Phthorimaea operculella]